MLRLVANLRFKFKNRLIMLKRFYDGFVLRYPKSILILVLLTIAFCGYQIRKLEIDASAETLMLEDDPDLRISREINERYKTQDFLVITYSPKEDLLSDKTLDTIRRLKEELIKLERVESITSILDVPLLESPPKPVSEMVKSVPTMESPDIDKTLAKKEFLNSPLYENNLVSSDFKTTALMVNLHDDHLWQDFIKRRNALRTKEKEGVITAEEQKQLEKVSADFKAHRDYMRDLDNKNIREIRAIVEKYKGDADLFLGGITMIADDLITFVKSDLRVFGTGVLIFLIIMLWIIFRQVRWILFPIICCALSVIATCGLLGLVGWEVTVVSSNFISIQIIITMAITIHLIVRYRELAASNPESDQRQLVLDTVLSMAKPCLYAILTTMAGFSSLVFCNILPVINFGWMMTAGIGVSLILTFLLFPTIQIHMEKKRPNTSFESFFAVTKKLGTYTEKHGTQVLLISGAVLLFCVGGAAQLMVENSFIDYFKDTTEIYRGMKVIDQQLGGTTPLDVVLNFEVNDNNPVAKETMVDGEEDSEFDEFEEEFEKEKNKAQYWFTSDKMQQVEKVHDYLNSVPEIGKVVSLGTMLKVGKTLNEGKPLDNFMMALIYNELPEEFRKIILNPYVAVKDNQVRFAARIRDSEPNLRRNALLHRMQREMENDLGLKKENFKLSGMMVMYNNTLQSLFNSQIMTIGAVILALMVMFLILFRSFKIALIAIFPNILSVGVVLGFMGWAKIPLDMMTITIAAISVGIAVDDTIHYIHRFKKSLPLTRIM